MNRRDFVKLIGTSAAAVTLPATPSPRDLETLPVLEGDDRYVYELPLCQRPGTHVLATYVDVPVGIPCRVTFEKPHYAVICGLRTFCAPREVIMLPQSIMPLTIGPVDASFFTTEEHGCPVHYPSSTDCPLYLDLDAVDEDRWFPLIVTYSVYGFPCAGDDDLVRRMLRSNA